MSRFEQIVVSLCGTWDPSLPIAAARAGYVGVLDLTYLDDATHARSAVQRLNALAQGRYGLLLSARVDDVFQAAVDATSGAECIVLVPDHPEQLGAAIEQARHGAQAVGLVVTCLADAELAAAHQLDFVYAKGHEAGGRVGEETCFVLLQRLMAWGKLPVYAWGGIGRRTIAAAQVAGAQGVVLDWQLALTRESPLTSAQRRRLATFDGSETAIVQYADDRWFRFHTQPRSSMRQQLETFADRCRFDRVDSEQEFERGVYAHLTDAAVGERLLPLGQDTAFAPALSPQGESVARVLQTLDASRREITQAAACARATAPGSPLAQSHGTEFPIVQGPMTHVSDVPEFCHEVARNGALPFLALALMRGTNLKQTLEKTKHLMGDLPWGVGVLGFVPQELRAEQMPLIEEIGPTHAIIAGGRPDQAATLEARGIKTYLHVPSPGMLETFLGEGARRFVFEGRECGGHVGPRTSFVLWESMIEVLLAARLSAAEAQRVHVLFAGGIHDARSAAMVAALAQPLVDAGVKIGMLLGTAYLATREVVDTGAVLPNFRDVTLHSDHTVLLETGPGHAIRCADTDFAQAFEQLKREMKAAGHSHEEIRDELERLNLGRLRMASKGIVRAENPAPGESLHCAVDEQRQRVQGMFMLGQVAALRSATTTLRELHEDVSLHSAERLQAFETRVEVVSREEPAPEAHDIAIVGLGCLVPGATDPASFWDNILNKRDLIEEVPSDRFAIEQWFDADPAARDKIYSRWGGFVPHILFDPMKYGIPPASLKSIEPMQLMALELVARSLADAGYAEHNPARARTSVILGVGGGAAELGVGYGFRSLLPKFFEQPEEAILAELPEWTEDSFAGILLNVVAGRVANRFDLGGANFTVDAACASSLAAVYLACRELSTRACDMVVTGGCDTMQGPMGYLCFAKTGALSPRGRSRPFDSTADGIAISEGHAAVVLKRRADAERDGDRIYAIIRAAAGGSDGRHKGLTAPRLEGQLQTLKRAYDQAGISPATVSLFEAHGTGTVVGDQTECLALRQLLEDAQAPADSVAVGSVKSMIGHTKCAAGVSGLVKTALALHHRVLPATLHVERPSAKAGLDQGPLYVNSETRPWLSKGAARRAGVSAFGFGGSNFHVVLEEYPNDPRGAATRFAHRQLPVELFAFKANSPQRLASAVRSLAESVHAARDAGADISLANLAYTLHVRQAGMEGDYRAAVLARSVDELLQRLATLQDKLQTATAASTAGVFYTPNPLGTDSPLAMLFPGQGSQHPDMLRELAVEFGEVAECFEQADALTADDFEMRLSDYILPPPRFSDEQRAADCERLKQTDIAQPALGVCDLAVATLLASFGVQPDLVAGHSYGELVALHVAGAYDRQAMYRLSVERGRAMRAAAATAGETGTMLAVSAGAEQVQAALADTSDVWLANLNSPRQTVISGTRAGIEQARQRLQQAEVTCQPIAVSCAFHSPLMSAASQQFAQACADIAWSAPSRPVYSNATAAPYAAESADLQQTLVAQIENRVRFCEQIEALYAAGARVFVEAGPGRVLTNLVREILSGRPHAVIATQARGACGYTQFVGGLAELFAHGVDVDTERLYEGRQLQIIDLKQLTQQAQAGPARHLWWLHGSAIRPVTEAPRSAPERGRFVRPSDEARPTLSTELSHEMPDESSAQFDASTHMNSASGPAFDDASLTPDTSYNETVPSPSPEQETDSLRWVQPTSESAAAEAHAQFQQTMRQFLEVQRSVMLTFLGQADTAGSPPAIENRYIAGVNGHANEQPRALAPPPVTNGSPHPAAPPAAEVARPVPPAPVEAVRPQPVASAPAPQPTAAAPAPVAPVPVAPAPAAPAPASVALDEQLLAIVSQRTGYPVEMLDLEANLEADLGIDSIKRVEIISAFRRETLPDMKEPPAEFMERMTAAKTMRTILDVVGDFQSNGHAAKAGSSGGNNGRSKRSATPAREAEGEAVNAPRCIPAVVEAPLTTPGTIPSMHGMWVLTDDRLGVSKAVARRVETLGGQCAILAVEELSDALRASAALQRVRAAGLPIRGILHLAPLGDAAEFPLLAADQWRAAYEAEVKSLFFALQACDAEMQQQSEERFTVLGATRGGGDFDSQDGSECQYPWRGGIAGMLKVVAREYPQVRCRAIDFADLPDPECLIAEATGDGAKGAIDIAYRAGQRVTVVAVREELPAVEPAEAAVDLNADSVVLVLAGGKGITATVACELAAQAKCKFILAGRSPAPADEDPSLADCSEPVELRRRLMAILQSSQGQMPQRQQVEQLYKRVLSDREIRQTLAEIAASGAQAEYVACDVQDAEQLTSLVQSVYERYGRIDAVVHGAGIIEDKFLVDKTSDSFERVVATKIDPLLTLAKVLDHEQLKLLVLFSSVSGFFGNPGQVDYSVANEMLNRLARRLRDTWHCKVISFCWGPWAGAGMVKPEVAQQFAERGVGLISVAAGRRAAWQEIVHHDTRDVRVIVGPGVWVEEADRRTSEGTLLAVRTPLLSDQVVTRKNATIVEAEFTLDASRHPFLRDHTIDGNAVLPLAFALECMAELAAAAEPGLHVSEIADLRQLKGIVLPKNMPHTLPLRAERIERSPTHAKWRVRLMDPTLQTRPHYECVVVLTGAVPPAPQSPEFEPLSGEFPLDIDEGYRRWLFHGPLFQAIEFYRGYDESGVDCIVRPSNPAACMNRQAMPPWLIDPVVIDVAPQLAALWSRAQTDTMLLPSRLTSLRRFAPIGKDPLECYFRIHNSEGHTVIADVWLVRDNVVLAEVQGLECAGNRELNRITGGVLV